MHGANPAKDVAFTLMPLTSAGVARSWLGL